MDRPLLEKEIHFMPDRLNEEPVIFIGMTNSELKTASLISMSVWIPCSIVLAAVVGKAVLGLALGVGLAFVTLWLLGKRLRVLKRGKPKQYHAMAIRAFFEDRGLLSKTMIRQNQVWDIRRQRRTK